MATLFGITDYRSLAVTGKSGTAKSSSDPNLLYYNCIDVATTLVLYDFTWSQIREKYGENSFKMSDVCRQMRNAVLWSTIILEQNGCMMDRTKLEKVDLKYKELCKKAIQESADNGVLVAGEGSEASSRDFMKRALEELGLLHDRRVQLTEKKKEISVGKDNFNLLIEHSTEAFKYWKPLQAIKTYHEASKIVDTYTKTLLSNPAKGMVYNNMTYPSWYPMSGIAAKYSGTTGGTIQGRLSCKDPGAQTYPEVIKKCICSRFVSGQITGYDLSQIELRMAALVSGDKVMIQEYIEGIDRHTETALLIWPDADINDPEFSAKGHFGGHKREFGKTTNFLILYRGGAKKLQEIGLNEFGITLPIALCKHIIEALDKKYWEFRLWQERNLELVKKQGYLELPTGWSRTWGTGDIAKFVSEIADFPIQTLSAQVLQSAHYEIEKRLLSHNLLTKTTLQIHDALYTDSPKEEMPEIDQLVGIILPHPPVLQMLESFYNRKVPILFEKEVL